MPVDLLTTVYVQAVGADKLLHPDFGVLPTDGIPFTVVPGDQAKVPVLFTYNDESDAGPYPIPADALIEGGSDSTGDRHVLIVDRDNCVLYELFNAYPQPDGSWGADAGAIFDLNSDALRPDGWTSADAAGLPILPGLVRYEEVAAGEIAHALRVTVPFTAKQHLWPARHSASLTDALAPPLGSRFRLRADFDISGFSPDAQVILRALKKYGVIVADNGSPWFISGAPDPSWNMDQLVTELRQIRGSDFEVIDATALMVNTNLAQALLAP